MKKLPLIIAISCCLAAACTVHEHDVQRLNIETPVITGDISNQRVTAFAEDAQGHIWIGTFRGLNRYNVHEFQQHFCTSDLSTLPDNQVQCLHKDSRDRLWVSTVNGMALYTEQDDFVRIPMETMSRNTAQILETADGDIYINTLVELAKYDEPSGTFKSVLSSVDGKMPTAIQAFIQDSDSSIWFVASTHLLKYDLSTFEVKEFIPLDKYTTAFNVLDNGVIWMGGMGSVLIYDTVNGRFVDTPKGLSSHKLFNKAQVSHIYSYGEEVLFNTEKHGMFIYNPAEDMLYHQDEKGFPFEVPDAKITTMYLDSSDNLWLGTYDQGYHVIYAYEELFNNDSWLKSSLGQKSVVSVDSDSNDNLWISTLKDGLYMYNADLAIFKKIDMSRLYNYEAADNLDITHVFVDSRDKVWLTGSGGVSRCRVKNNDLVVEKSWPLFSLWRSQRMRADAYG